MNGGHRSDPHDDADHDRDAPQALLEALAKQAGIDTDDINEQDVGPTWGSRDLEEGDQGLIVVLVRDLALHLVPVRVEDGGRRDGRACSTT